MRNAYRSAQISKMDGDATGAWDNKVTQIAREGREEEEGLKEVDEELAKSASEIVNMGIAI